MVFVLGICSLGMNGSSRSRILVRLKMYVYWNSMW